MSDVEMVSTSPTDCRMPANSLLRSFRSEASNSRRLDEDGLARVVIIPHRLAVRPPRSQDYLIRDFLALKGYYERWFNVERTI